MSQEIKNRLEQFIQQEQALLDQLFQLKRQRVDVGAEIGKTIISEGAAAFAADLFESSVAGRLGRKLTKAIIDEKQKQQFLIQERNMENQHNFLLQSVRAFLSFISLKRRNLMEPNSSELVAKLDRAQEFVKVDTRIRRTTTALRGIANKPLIYNKDIPAQRIVEVIVPPGEPFTSSIKLKEILRCTHGYAKIIDPYVDEITLEFLLSIPKEVPIKLLTAYMGGDEKEGRFKRACQRFKSERPQFEIRKCEPRLIHDRFILSQTQGWSIGSSLKDIGKKLSMIKELSTQTKNEAENMFDQIWSKSIDLIT